MVHIWRSTVIDAPIDEVWAFVREYNAHDQWHPAVSVSQIEDQRMPDEVGCVRDFLLNDGGGIREQLLSLDDRNYTYSYCILDAPVPLVGYVATVKLKPVTDGNRTFWQWESYFYPPKEREEELAAMVRDNVYEAGFAAARAWLKEKRPLKPYEIPPAGNLPEKITEAAAPKAGPSTATIESHAVFVTRYGGPEVLEWKPVTVSPPGAGEVRIRHTAIGVNYIDVYARTGAFNLLAPPGVPGMEAAGIVIDTGEGVHHLMRGQRVAYACPPVGAYSAIRTMPAALVLPLPDHIGDEMAAAIMLKGMTAEFLLHRVHRLQAGATVLVHAAAGGTGQLLCQWARALGAMVIGTAGSTEKLHIARASGCHHVIDYQKEDFTGRVKEITEGRGVDAVFDGVGAATFAKSYEALAVNGHLVSFGQASGAVPAINISAYASKSATISRPNFGHYTGTPEQARLSADRLFRAVQAGVLVPSAPTCYALKDAAKAHRALEGRDTYGPVILIPGG